MGDIKRKAKVKSFYIALVYVGIGSLALYSMFSPHLMSSELISNVSLITILITFPVTFIGFATAWGSGQNAYFLVPLIQVVVFLLFWYILNRFLQKRYQEKF